MEKLTLHASFWKKPALKHLQLHALLSTVTESIKEVFCCTEALTTV